MQPEKALLEAISDKEHDLKETSTQIRKQAEDIVSQARKEAARIIDTADREGKETANAQYLKEMAILNEDMEKIRQEGERRAGQIRADGRAILPEIAGYIVTLVTR